jgi:hypothetical protein
MVLPMVLQSELTQWMAYVYLLGWLSFGMLWIIDFLEHVEYTPCGKNMLLETPLANDQSESPDS